jgi:hypothetical protein
MTRITILLLLLMFWSGAAFAAVYQCRNKDGSLFLTNNRNNYPQGCVQVGEPIGGETAPSPPAATPPPRAQVPARVPGTGFGGAKPGQPVEQPPTQDDQEEE